MKRVFLIGLVAIEVAIAGDNLCFEYPSSSYTLTNTRYIQQKGKDEPKEIIKKLDTKKYRLILAISKHPTRLHNHYIFLIKKASGDELDYTPFECPDKSLNPKYFYCYAESDNGIISFERDNRINFKTASIGVGDSPDSPKGTWEIRPKYEADLPAPKSIKCPTQIASQNINLNANNKKYIDSEVKYFSKNILSYVCYASKVILKSRKAIYKGCRFTKDKCDSYGWKSFGHYLSEEETLKAFERCKKSIPNR